CGLPPIVAQYAAEAFVASDRSLACLPERQRDDVVEALVIALVVIVLDVFTHDGSKMPLANGHESSSPGEFHPQALSEPDVKLSPHPALPIEPHGIPNNLLRNVVRLRLSHRLLPSPVGRCPWPDCRTPSLRPRYQASSLLRVRPSLCLASVLGSSWVHHLEFSLHIEAAGSHVPHKSLRRAHAAFMPVTTRAVSRHPSSFIPGPAQKPGFGDVYAFSTLHQRFTHVRLPSAHLTGMSRLFRLAHHPGHWTRAASGGLVPGPAPRAEGPTLISYAARQLLGGHDGLPSAPSWRTMPRRRCAVSCPTSAACRGLLASGCCGRGPDQSPWHLGAGVPEPSRSDRDRRETPLNSLDPRCDEVTSAGF